MQRRWSSQDALSPDDDVEGADLRLFSGGVFIPSDRKQDPAAEPAKPARERMQMKLLTEKSRTTYAKRKWVSEAPDGWIRQMMGFRRFSLRGLHKVQDEWDRVCLSLNVKRLQALQMG